MADIEQTTPPELAGKETDLIHVISELNPEVIHVKSQTTESVDVVKRIFRTCMKNANIAKGTIITQPRENSLHYPIFSVQGKIKVRILAEIIRVLDGFAPGPPITREITGNAASKYEYYFLRSADPIEDPQQNLWKPAVELFTNLSSEEIQLPLTDFSTGPNESVSRLVYRKLPQPNPPPISQ